jgi:hypothetical protein
MQRAAHQPTHPIFPPDVSAHMLEVPRRRPRFDWILFAIAAGVVVALVVLAISNLVF